MFFPSPEQRASAAQFDAFLDSTRRVLRSPVLQGHLRSIGSLGLTSLPDQLFLPNFKEGQYITPRSERDTANPAFVPLPEGSMDNWYELVEPVLADDYRQVWTADEAAVSKRYGLTGRQEELRHSLAVGKSASSTGQPRSSPSHDLAFTQYFLYNYKTPYRGGEYALGRPVVIARARLLSGNWGWLRGGAALLHELVHVQDMHPLLLKSLTYRCATELRAHYVEAAAYDVHAGDRLNEDRQVGFAHWIDELRRDHGNRSSEHPFTPTPALVRVMREAGVI